MIKVVIADDHALMREGLKHILQAVTDIQICAEATNGFETLQSIRSNPCDVLIMDLSMPGKGGMELIRQVKEEVPQIHILVLTMHEEHEYAARAIRAGALGYMTKEGAGSQLVIAIRRVATGRPYISMDVAEQLAIDAMPTTRRIDQAGEGIGAAHVLQTVPIDLRADEGERLRERDAPGQLEPGAAGSQRVDNGAAQRGPQSVRAGHGDTANPVGCDSVVGVGTGENERSVSGLCDAKRVVSVADVPRHGQGGGAQHICDVPRLILNQGHVFGQGIRAGGRRRCGSKDAAQAESHCTIAVGERKVAVPVEGEPIQAGVGVDRGSDAVAAENDI